MVMVMEKQLDFVGYSTKEITSSAPAPALLSESLIPNALEALGWVKVKKNRETKWQDPSRPNAAPEDTKYAWYLCKLRVKSKTAV